MPRVLLKFEEISLVIFNKKVPGIEFYIFLKLYINNQYIGIILL
jgi:hypothetical protein